MASRTTCLTDPTALLVADASAVISVNATGCAEKVWRALPNHVIVMENVRLELEVGRDRQRPDAALLDQLRESKVLEIVDLDAKGETYFEPLVIGTAAQTLDDGEAATIAHAVSRSGIAILDEKKAVRICAEKLSALRVANTVDILAHPSVEAAIGEIALAEAVFMALSLGRMRVFPHHYEWVVRIIGPERVKHCRSFPSSVRSIGVSVARQPTPLKSVAAERKKAAKT